MVWRVQRHQELLQPGLDKVKRGTLGDSVEFQQGCVQPQTLEPPLSCPEPILGFSICDTPTASHRFIPSNKK